MMETPFNKSKGSAFRKFNLFTSSTGKLQPNELLFNSNMSLRDNYHLLSDKHNFSFSKFITTNKKEYKEAPKTKDQSLQTEFKTEKENFYKLNLKKNSFKINNINFNINFSYLKNEKSETKDLSNISHSTDFTRNVVTPTDCRTAKKSEKEKSYNINTAAIKQNLLSRLQESDCEKEKKHFAPNKISVKVFPEFSLEEKDVYSDREIEEKLNYILDQGNNIKKEYQKSKMTNSCKCAKTGCKKFSCNCMRNGVSCDFLCACKNCQNKNQFLKLKTSREAK